MTTLKNKLTETQTINQNFLLKYQKQNTYLITNYKVKSLPTCLLVRSIT